MGHISILIPAAGAASRMRGADKLLRTVHGKPLIRHLAEQALQVADDVTVTLPAFDHPRADALAGLPLRRIAVPDAHLGMSASVRRGVGMLPKEIDAVMVLPADMPDLLAQDLDLLIRAYRAAPRPMLFQATSSAGQPGHPVLFPADCFAAMRALVGDQGAKSVLMANQHRLRQIALPGSRALTDLDTPEDWKHWEALNAAPA